MTDFLDLTIHEASKALTEGEFSAEELVLAHIKSIEGQRDLNMFITETPEVAIQGARESDLRRSKGMALGCMDGIPVAVKDLFCTKGILTTAGSRILSNFIPTYESTITEKMNNAGAVLLGKSNLDEFAMGSSTTTSFYGSTINPWGSKKEVDLVPGGSSGGSAAAVAAKAAMGALGTDTGGSIRQPASFCGVVGLKPTYGRCSRWGIVAFASSLDQAGPITRSVHDAAIFLSAIAGYDAKDSTSVPVDSSDFEQSLYSGIKGMKFGIPKEYIVENMPAEITKLWEKGITWLEDRGAECMEVSLPHTKYALPAYYIIAPAEASSNLARYDGVRYGIREKGGTLNEMYELTRAKGFGDEVQRRILVGTYVLSAGYYDAYYVKAQKVRTLITEDFAKAFKKVEAILTPTTPSAAFCAKEKCNDPISMYLNDVFTVPASLAGLPGVSVPSGLDSNGLPLGLQLIGKPFEEATLLKAAQALEEGANFGGSAPKGLEV